MNGFANSVTSKNERLRIKCGLNGAYAVFIFQFLINQINEP